MRKIIEPKAEKQEDWRQMPNEKLRYWSSSDINLLEPEFYIYISAHPVGKMRIIQEPNKIALWNKRHFEEKKTEIMQHV